MIFLKGLGAGLLISTICIIIFSILTFAIFKSDPGTAFIMLIMFLVTAAFNVGFVYFGSVQGFGRASQVFFFIFVSFMFMFSIVSLVVGSEELSSKSTNMDIALTRTSLIACGLTYIVWYFMLGNGYEGSIWVVGAVPLASSIIGFILALLFTLISPIFSLVVAILVAVGSIATSIILRIKKGSLLD